MMLRSIFTALLLCALPLFAQQPSFRPTRTVVPPVIDGYGNDAAWLAATPITDFVQRTPLEGAPPTERTEMRILFDDENLYVYAKMSDPHPDSIVSRLTRRDNMGESDWFGIALDSYHDRQTAFTFVTMSSGSRADFLMYNDDRDEDWSWDPVWETRTRILPDGWSAEMKIPLSQIRFTPGNDVWGMAAARHNSRRQEDDYSNLVSKKKDGFVSQFAEMSGMADLHPPTLLEVLPYAVGSSEHYPQTSDREKVERLRPNAGVDIKYGVTSNFTLDATVNPDFAQVEADPAVLNLTTFETFYPEKRPFFIEGTQIIRFVTFGGDFGPGLFYSRRIGRPISASLPSDGKIITDEPRTATILGAAKFSGRTAGGTSIGVLTGLTDEESFSYRDTTGVVKSLRAEPSASYNLVRVRQDFWGNSNIGAIVTGTARNGVSPEYTTGMDWDVKFDSSTYRVNGFVAVSHGHKYIDRYHDVSMQPSMQQGSAGKINIGKVSGEWTYGAGYDFTGRKYFINDIGFFRSPNDHGAGIHGGYRNFTPGEWFRSYSFNTNLHLRWNYDRMILFRELTLNSSAELVSYWSLDGTISYSLGGQDPYEPRGYGVYHVPASIYLKGEIESDSRQPVVGSVEQEYRAFDDGGRTATSSLSLVVHPTTAMDYTLSLGYGTERGLSRFADAVNDSLVSFAKTDKAALYGKRDVDGLDLTLRSSILFTHDLSLQVYNQFFWAKGRYDVSTYSLLAPSRTLIPYASTANNDFNSTSLQTNVVLRWEYREGSTFYFVWSHGRAFSENGGYNTGLGDNITNTFVHTKPNNVYGVKASYWMSL